MPAAMEARYNLKSPGRPQQAALRAAAGREGAGRAGGAERSPNKGQNCGPASAPLGRRGPARGPSGRASRAGPGRAADAGCARRVGPRCLETLELSLRGAEYLGAPACLYVSTPFYSFSWLVDA